MQGREYFGFKDGLSQPILDGSRDAERFPESMHLTELGEIVLGYRNADGLTPAVPSLTSCPEFGKNGTYLVARQLQQHVDAFRDFVNEKAGHDPMAADYLASKIVGRELDGTPLVPYTTADDNEFGFAEDAHGYGCPMGAHIRRANPRDAFVNTNAGRPSPRSANRHRIVRRGRAYETNPQDDVTHAWERGLLFVGLNGDLERQFEFIQGDWINNSGFAGLSDERDPLIGHHTGDQAFTIQGLPAPACVAALPHFVTVRGGELFFLLPVFAPWNTSRTDPRMGDAVADVNQNGGSIERVLALIKGRLLRLYAPPRIKRDAHPKVHGLVQAELIVDAKSDSCASPRRLREAREVSSLGAVFERIRHPSRSQGRHTRLRRETARRQRRASSTPATRRTRRRTS